MRCPAAEAPRARHLPPRRRFNRPEADCEALRALRPEDLRAFFQAAVAAPASRRKLTVRFEGNRQPSSSAAAGGEGPAAASAAAAASHAAPAAEGPAAPAAGAEEAAAAAPASVDGGLEVEEIAEPYAWRRRQPLHASSK